MPCEGACPCAICCRSSPRVRRVCDSLSRPVVAWSLSWLVTCCFASPTTLRACSAAVPATLSASSFAVPATCLPWSAAVDAVSLALSVVLVPVSLLPES